MTNQQRKANVRVDSTKQVKMNFVIKSLLLLSLCSLSMCQERSYHFVNLNKTWSDAQRYCRHHFTDLATVYDQTDAERICKSENNCQNRTGAWIGLHRKKTKNSPWRWSQSDLKYDSSQAQWETGQPDNNIRENCVFVRRTTKWHNCNCATPQRFICYSAETNSYEEPSQRMTWWDALKHCRDNNTDLIGGQQQFPDKPYDYWIGLYRDAWKWSDGSSSSFRNWEESDNALNPVWNPRKKQCARLEGKKKWKSEDCNNERPFICYDDQMILIKQNKTWYDAMLYCQHNHDGLAMMTDWHELRMAQERADRATSEYVWVGLNYTCFSEEWIWVDGSYVKLNRWHQRKPDECGLAGAMKRSEKKQWFGVNAEDTFNFVCSTSCRYKKWLPHCKFIA